MHSLNKLISSSRAVLATGTVALLSAPIAVFAQVNPDLEKNLQDAGGAAFGQAAVTSEQSLPKTVGNLISAALGLLGVVMVVLVIYAGYLYLTAAGNDEKVEDAKKILKNAVIGAILIFTAYAITDFVVKAVISSSSPG